MEMDMEKKRVTKTRESYYKLTSESFHIENRTKKRLNEWPWALTRNSATYTQHDEDYIENYRFEQPMFSAISYWNEHFDNFTLRAAFAASQSVVSIVSYSADDNVIFQCSGIIIEENGTILTSNKLATCLTTENVLAENIKVIVYLLDGTFYEAQLLIHDFYYGIAVFKAQQNVRELKPACLRLVDDYVSLDLRDFKELPFRPYSNGYNLVPGDKVIALGRYFIKPYDLMAAPGVFSIKRCSDNFECKELFSTTCLITTIGVGGPIINQNGEVIGVVTCDDDAFTPFIPLNIALKWWQHYKKFQNLPRRPLFGMKMANLYTTDLQVMEKLIKKNPNNYTGVIVEEVTQGSSADFAGLCPNDLIILCCGKTVWSFLELFDMMWDKIGNSVDLCVIRARDDTPLHLCMEVVEAT